VGVEHAEVNGPLWQGFVEDAVGRDAEPVPPVAVGSGVELTVD
jgi:hypothetical protein